MCSRSIIAYGDKHSSKLHVTPGKVKRDRAIADAIDFVIASISMPVQAQPSTAQLHPVPRFLPWWHHKWDRWRDVKVSSGCATSGGRVQCDPDDMRAKAQKKLEALGVWRGPLSLATYTLARYIASEVGSGTPEEKVAVAEAAVHRVTLENLRDVNSLLLYRIKGSAGYGAYGPIHGSSMDAPFGRWAATSRDPDVDDLLIADFVLTGRSQNFSRGADDQWGPEIEGDEKHPVGWGYRAVAGKKAQGRKYWTGPLPGVDHWHTFLFRTRKDTTPDSPTGLALIAAGQAALSQRPSPWRMVMKPGATTGRAVRYKTDWSVLAVAPAPSRAPVRVAVTRPRVAAASIAGIAIFMALAAGVGLWAGVRADAGRPLLWI
jgi:hypothetical protein